MFILRSDTAPSTSKCSLIVSSSHPFRSPVSDCTKITHNLNRLRTRQSPTVCIHEWNLTCASKRKRNCVSGPHRRQQPPSTGARGQLASRQEEAVARPTPIQQPRYRDHDKIVRCQLPSMCGGTHGTKRTGTVPGGQEEGRVSRTTARAQTTNYIPPLLCLILYRWIWTKHFESIFSYCSLSGLGQSLEWSWCVNENKMNEQSIGRTSITTMLQKCSIRNWNFTDTYKCVGMHWVNLL